MATSAISEGFLMPKNIVISLVFGQIYLREFAFFDFLWILRYIPEIDMLEPVLMAIHLKFEDIKFYHLSVDLYNLSDSKTKYSLF
jgi:hypothetical protein